MGLTIVDHLQAMLDDAQPIVGTAEQLCIVGGDDPFGSQRIERGARAAQPEGGQAAAVNELVGLGEELDLADAAPPTLEIEAGPWLGRAGIVAADPAGKTADFFERHEIDAAAPDEGADRGEKLLARLDVTRSRAGADIGGAFPGER